MHWDADEIRANLSSAQVIYHHSYFLGSVIHTVNKSKK